MENSRENSSKVAWPQPLLERSQVIIYLLVCIQVYERLLEHQEQVKKRKTSGKTQNLATVVYQVGITTCKIFTKNNYSCYVIIIKYVFQFIYSSMYCIIVVSVMSF